jgi:hypothetical protein
MPSVWLLLRLLRFNVHFLRSVPRRSSPAKSLVSLQFGAVETYDQFQNKFLEVKSLIVNSPAVLPLFNHLPQLGGFLNQYVGVHRGLFFFSCVAASGLSIVRSASWRQQLTSE